MHAGLRVVCPGKLLVLGEPCIDPAVSWEYCLTIYSVRDAIVVYDGRQLIGHSDFSAGRHLCL